MEYIQYKQTRMTKSENENKKIYNTQKILTNKDYQRKEVGKISICLSSRENVP